MEATQLQPGWAAGTMIRRSACTAMRKSGSAGARCRGLIRRSGRPSPMEQTVGQSSRDAGNGGNILDGERATCHQEAQLGSKWPRIHPLIANPIPSARAPSQTSLRRSLLSEEGLAKAGCRAESLLDFAVKAVTHRKRVASVALPCQFATADESALGADEAGLLGRLLTVEPDLGDSAAVTRRLRHVVLHRPLVAFDAGLGGSPSGVDSLSRIAAFRHPEQRRSRRAAQRPRRPRSLPSQRFVCSCCSTGDSSAVVVSAGACSSTLVASAGASVQNWRLPRPASSTRKAISAERSCSPPSAG